LELLPWDGCVCGPGPSSLKEHTRSSTREAEEQLMHVGSSKRKKRSKKEARVEDISPHSGGEPFFTLNGEKTANW